MLPRGALMIGSFQAVGWSWFLDEMNCYYNAT